MESCRKYYSDFSSGKVSEVMDNNLKIMINFSNLHEEHIKKQVKNKQKNIPSIERFFINMCQDHGHDGNVEFVDLRQLQIYVDQDREFVVSKGKRYLDELTDLIATEGLNHPIWMCVNRRSGRGYIHDGNHRVEVPMASIVYNI